MCDKVKFTKSEAEQALIRNKKSSKQYRKECRKYYCVFCNAWHLTSMEDKSKSLVVKVKLKYKNIWKKLMTA